MTRYKLIVNPAAGLGASMKALPKIESELNRLVMDYSVEQTDYPWHAALLAREAAVDGVDVVVAVGGDGTVNEVINGLMDAKRDDVAPLPAMGVLSAGRGNDFAYGAGIPIDLDRGCQVLKDGYQSSIDVGYVEGGLFPEGRYFGNGVGIGFDAIVGFEALKLKPLSGFTAYMIAALKTVFLYDNAPHVKIVLDERSYTQPALMVSIMNGRRMGGGFMMAPNSDISDGMFDLCIAGDVSKLNIFPLIFRFIKGNQETHEAVIFDRSRKVTVTAQNNATLPAHGDGETLCEDGNHLTLELLPNQLKVVTAQPVG